MPLQVELVAADRLVWSGVASSVSARTIEGDIGVLPGHTPVLAILAEGEVRIDPVEGAAVVAHAGGGFLSIERDRVTIVSENASMASAGGTPT